MTDGLRIEIDFRKPENRKLTMVQVLAFLDREMKTNPDREYYQSGTYYSIVSKPKKVNA